MSEFSAITCGYCQNTITSNPVSFKTKDALHKLHPTCVADFAKRIETETRQLRTASSASFLPGINPVALQPMPSAEQQSNSETIPQPIQFPPTRFTEEAAEAELHSVFPSRERSQGLSRNKTAQEAAKRFRDDKKTSASTRRALFEGDDETLSTKPSTPRLQRQNSANESHSPTATEKADE